MQPKKLLINLIYLSFEGQNKGVITQINIEDHKDEIKIYFDNLHKDYWLNKN